MTLTHKEIYKKTLLKTNNLTIASTFEDSKEDRIFINYNDEVKMEDSILKKTVLDFSDARPTDSTLMYIRTDYGTHSKNNHVILNTNFVVYDDDIEYLLTREFNDDLNVINNLVLDCFAVELGKVDKSLISAKNSLRILGEFVVNFDEAHRVELAEYINCFVKDLAIDYCNDPFSRERKYNFLDCVQILLNEVFDRLLFDVITRDEYKFNEEDGETAESFAEYIKGCFMGSIMHHIIRSPLFREKFIYNSSTEQDYNDGIEGLLKFLECN